MNTLQQKIESLLFFKNEPVSFSWLAKQLGLKASDIESNILEMKPFYLDRGFSLITTEGKVALMTSKIADELIGNITKSGEERELSKQALETLSIVLYKKKITKAELDYIRGVNSVFILRNLLIRGLVEKNINLTDKRSPLYSVTHDTLSFLGIEKASDLPQFKHFTSKLGELENRWNSELESEKITEENKE
ncbi:MAG: SMC-Scp complex subunit ScpB [Candidatus Pacebacteria bacterium]|nr:SMC-Scp complex subunit ScpB [Candidatus Paceibacterota bacterium]